MLESDEAALGRAVKEWREARGFSQAQLAEAMNEAGAAWFPQTVTKVEAGSRALKFREGLLLARVLGVEPADLYERATPAPGDIEARRASEALAEASESLRHQVVDVWWAECNLMKVEARYHGVLSPAVAARAEQTRHRFGTAETVQRVVEEAEGLGEPSDRFVLEAFEPEASSGADEPQEKGK